MTEAIREYKRCSPAAEVLRALGPRAACAATQSALMRRLETDAALATWPPSRRYALTVALALAAANEASPEASNEVYAKIAELTGFPTEDDVSHVSFEAGDARLCLRVYERSNQVGLRLWPAAELAAAWIAADPERWRGTTVVELGAGLGLCGLAAAAFGSPRVVHLTDADDVVLRNLAYNVELNGLRCIVETLDWTAFSGDSPLLEAPAISVIAADCVYDDAVAPAFAAVLRRFADAGARIFLCNALRNDRTWEAARAALEDRGLSVGERLTAAAVAAVDAASTRGLLPRSVWALHRRAALSGALRLVEIAPLAHATS